MSRKSWQDLLPNLLNGQVSALARSISLIENEGDGYLELLAALPSARSAKIIGITGPPGAGKSTLTDGLIGRMVAAGKRVAVLCVDPSSPFNRGALLGDRIRMSEWYTHPQVFIRSLASRGSLGGLHPRILEITDLLGAAPFDFIIVETVGVGQSEVEIAGLADVTAVVLVPEAGDEVQVMKAGLMEIASLFVVNKADRPGADAFVKNLLQLFPAAHPSIPVLQTIATEKQGIQLVFETLCRLLAEERKTDRHFWLLAQKAYLLIAQRRMKDVDKKELMNRIRQEVEKGSFSLYPFVNSFNH